MNIRLTAAGLIATSVPLGCRGGGGGRGGGDERDGPRAARRITRAELQGKVRVTRSGVHVDRMATAWLIRRFIDRDASFRFVDPDGYRPAPNEVRFEMYEAGFSHEEDRCTFEVLCAPAAPPDPALQGIAEIVHDIDLPDGRFRRLETAGIERLVARLQAAAPGDEEHVARAADVFEALYHSFGRNE
jgi:hypothetical protein